MAEHLVDAGLAAAKGELDDMAHGLHALIRHPMATLADAEAAAL